MPKMLNVGPNLTDMLITGSEGLTQRPIGSVDVYELQRCLFVFARWHNYMSEIAM